MCNASINDRSRSTWPILWLETIDSTNSEAKRYAEMNDFGPRWIAAKEQVSGRGRRGREWVSEPGNLYASILFKPDIPIERAGLFCFVSALATIETVKHFVKDVHFTLKWPNDVLANGAKISGILIETGSIPSHGLWMCIGFGINIGLAPDIEDRKTVCLKSLGVKDNVTPEEVLECLSVNFVEFHNLFMEKGFESIRSRWIGYAEGVGQKWQGLVNGQSVTGKFVDLNHNGALMLESDNGACYEVTMADASIVQSI